MNKDIGAARKAQALDASSADDPMDYIACRALYVGGAGDVAVTMEGGGNVTFVGVAAGTILPIAATALLNTGTTATSVVALY